MVNINHGNKKFIEMGTSMGRSLEGNSENCVKRCDKNRTCSPTNTGPVLAEKPNMGLDHMPGDGPADLTPSPDDIHVNIGEQQGALVDQR